jgi:hypothetical protein
MMDSYELEKSVWCDDDFTAMGWHDVTVWAISTNSMAALHQPTSQRMTIPRKKVR